MAIIQCASINGDTIQQSITSACAYAKKEYTGFKSILSMDCLIGKGNTRERSRILILHIQTASLSRRTCPSAMMLQLLQTCEMYAYRLICSKLPNSVKMSSIVEMKTLTWTADGMDFRYTLHVYSGPAIEMCRTLKSIPPIMDLRYMLEM